MGPPRRRATASPSQPYRQLRRLWSSGASLGSLFGVASTTRPPARELTALAVAIGLNPLCSTFGLEKLHKLLRNNRPSEGLAELRASARSKRSSAWSCGRSRCGSSPIPDALDRFLSRRRPPHQGSSLLDAPGHPCTIRIMTTPGRRLRKTLPSKTGFKRPILQSPLKFILSFAMGFDGNA
jgi:hypothetical protein